MSAFRCAIFNLPGNRNRVEEVGSPRKEGGPISIFGSAYDKKKTNYAGRGTGFLGITTRLAECRPSVRTPSTKYSTTS